MTLSFLTLLSYLNPSRPNVSDQRQTSQRMIMDDLRPVTDEIEIKSLLVRERYYRDTCQWEKLRGCYHPDASKTSISISW